MVLGLRDVRETLGRLPLPTLHAISVVGVDEAR